MYLCKPEDLLFVNNNSQIYTISKIINLISNPLNLTIMKSIKVTLFSLAILFSFFSCEKKEDTTPTPTPKVYAEENFLQGFLIDGGFLAPTAVNASLNEFGFKFIPRVKGKMNSVVVKIPVAGSVGVRIWDLTTGARIGEEIFTVPTANADFTKTITPIALTKDRAYAITMYAYDYYKYQRTSTVYPITVGNITISNFDQSVAGTATSLSGFVGSFSDVFIGNTINGNVSFNFQQTE
jgi:hypothetical protein